MARSTQDAIAALSAGGVPAAAIDDVGTAVDSDHTSVRNMFRPATLNGTTMRVPEQPAIFSTMQRGAPTHVPKLDQDADHVRAWLDQKAKATNG